MRSPSPNGKSTWRALAQAAPAGAASAAEDAYPSTPIEGLPVIVRPDLTIVVPCRNERDNVGPLLDAIRRDLRGHAVEVVFVDDSDDGTVAAIKVAAERSAYPRVRVVHRTGSERAGGLGTAVVVGAELATSDFVAVMDADLQHPPALLPAMFECATHAPVDLVVASRYVRGGRAVGFSTARAVGSRLAGGLARLLFPRRLAGVSDPMSGFFLFRADALDMRSLAPDGFKILLEALVSAPDLRVLEIPYAFEPRHAGRSKASLREAGRYLRALLRLRMRSYRVAATHPALDAARAEVVSA